MTSLNVPTSANASVIEANYEAWRQNPDSVDPTWRAFFQGFTLGSGGVPPSAAPAAAAGAPIIDSLKQSHVHYLISTYRAIGHMEAHLDPPATRRRPTPSSRSRTSSSARPTSTPPLTSVPTSAAAR